MSWRGKHDRGNLFIDCEIATFYKKVKFAMTTL